MFDYHVHTVYSVDCATPMAESCEAAIRAGITEIAFTDHVDHQPSDPGFGYYRPEAYFRALENVRREFDGRLTILAGAEVDFHTDTRKDVASFVQSHGEKYDFLIGSVHYAAGGAMIYPGCYVGKSVDEIVYPYLDQVQAAVEAGWFDSIGHLDIPKRYLPKDRRMYEPARYRDRLDQVFKSMIAHGVGFEINTSGIRQAPKTSMPGPAVVRWYAATGGNRITTGTDSHTSRTIGAGVRMTLEMLRLCGIDEVLSFRNRVGSHVSIGSLLERSAA